MQLPWQPGYPTKRTRGFASPDYSEFAFFNWKNLNIFKRLKGIAITYCFGQDF
jgi:hypothetical protein